jgi:hypothetical protein
MRRLACSEKHLAVKDGQHEIENKNPLCIIDDVEVLKIEQTKQDIASCFMHIVHA